MQKHYTNKEDHVCAGCRNVCSCAACVRQRERRKTKKAISDALEDSTMESSSSSSLPSTTYHDAYMSAYPEMMSMASSFRAFQFAQTAANLVLQQQQQHHQQMKLLTCVALFGSSSIQEREILTKMVNTYKANRGVNITSLFSGSGLEGQELNTFGMDHLCDVVDAYEKILFARTVVSFPETLQRQVEIAPVFPSESSSTESSTSVLVSHTSASVVSSVPVEILDTDMKEDEENEENEQDDDNDVDFDAVI